MITYWALSGQRPKQRRSRQGWPGSSGTSWDWFSASLKNLITHARTQRARFLGYDITVQHRDTKLTRGQRTVNGRIALRVPPDVITAQCARYRQQAKAWHRSRLQNMDDYEIVRIDGAEYRGVVNYYLLARDVSRLNRLRWHAETSMLKTLAAKHGSSVTKMAARYRAKISTSDGPRTCFEARKERTGRKDLAARFGGISLRHDRQAVITDPVPALLPCPPQGADLQAPAAGMRAMRSLASGFRGRARCCADSAAMLAWCGSGARRSGLGRVLPAGCGVVRPGAGLRRSRWCRTRPGTPGPAGWARAGGPGRRRSGHGTGRARPATAASARCRPGPPGRRRSRGRPCTPWTAPRAMSSQPSAAPAPVSVRCTTVRCRGSLAGFACWCRRHMRDRPSQSSSAGSPKIHSAAQCPRAG